MHERPSLSETDTATLKEVGRNLVTAFVTDFPKELPSAIIYPETSARYVFHLFDPVFRKLAEERDVPKPFSFFFNLHISGTNYYTAFSLERFGGEDVVAELEGLRCQFDLSRGAGEHRQFNDANGRKEYEKYLLLSEMIGGVGPLREIARKRAGEIRRYVRRCGRPEKFAIFDDIVGFGGCVYEIRKLLGDPTIPAYVLVSTGNSKEFEESQPIKVGNFGRIGYLVHSGSLIDWNYGYSKWEIYGKTKTLGVDKNEDWESTYVCRTSDRNYDPERMVRFRNGLRELGRELASSL